MIPIHRPMSMKKKKTKRLSLNILLDSAKEAHTHVKMSKETSQTHANIYYSTHLHSSNNHKKIPNFCSSFVPFFGHPTTTTIYLRIPQIAKLPAPRASHLQLFYRHRMEPHAQTFMARAWSQVDIMCPVRTYVNCAFVTMASRRDAKLYCVRRQKIANHFKWAVRVANSFVVMIRWRRPPRKMSTSAYDWWRAA